MPFKSQAQEAFMYAKHPEIARKWSNEFGQPKKLPEYKPATSPLKEPKSPWMNMETTQPKKEIY